MGGGLINHKRTQFRPQDGDGSLIAGKSLTKPFKNLVPIGVENSDLPAMGGRNIEIIQSKLNGSL